MEINEVYDDAVELSLFSCKEGLFEIYSTYGIFYGIIYVEAATAYEKRDEIKNELEMEYLKNKRPTSDFISDFVARYNVQLPDDIFFDFNLESFLDKTS